MIMLLAARMASIPLYSKLTHSHMLSDFDQVQQKLNSKPQSCYVAQSSVGKGITITFDTLCLIQTNNVITVYTLDINVGLDVKAT